MMMIAADLAKDESKYGKPIGRTLGSSSTSDRDLLTHPFEGRQGGTTNVSSAVFANGNTVPASVKGSNPSTKSLDSYGSEVKAESRAAKSYDLRLSAGKDDSTKISDAQRPPSSRPGHSSRDDNSITASKSSDKLQKRASPSEELDKLNKHWKGGSG
ncbi:hypothetical protein F0562_006915 [Nyssa sinensis]|uniref:Uncharacterized protein n=1 Tax=Nyssa sinensis TaxID=561372 RepID=A0A5J5A727_9ASTE|nr:hypothetical protein F0562_006915 [Nyssa sinensis]